MQLQKQNNRQTPVINGIYQHYKGKKYKILMVAFNSEFDNLDPWVVYQGLYTHPQLGSRPIFTRSLAQFIETITVNGKSQDRFTFIVNSDM